MREFNTTGPCDPKLHYTVMREALIAEGKEKVHKGRYFTIFAPRQAGKTTYFQLLSEELKEEEFVAIWTSFENSKTFTKERFYQMLNYDLHRKLVSYEIQVEQTITDPLSLEIFFEELQKQSKAIVLIIDEFENIPDDVVGEIMHTFRKIYHQKKYYALHALILVGVSTYAELIFSSASPFNIADDLHIPYFTIEETNDLIAQYTTESGQQFEAEVIKSIYHNAKGQPGLVCLLCWHLINKVVNDKNKIITLNDFYTTLKIFLTKKTSLNIFNIVQKAQAKRSFMLKVLFQEQPIPFSVYDPVMGWLYAHGIIDEVDGFVDVPVPLYKKVLIAAFQPSINGEASHYVTSSQDTFQQYLNPDGGLHINTLLEAYRAYVHRRGFRAFDTDHLKEGAWHYSLDNYLNFFIERLGGQTFVEVPSGRGRTDILIRFKHLSYIIEVKRFTDNTYFKQGKRQLLAYLKSEGLDVGYYVVFSKVHTAKDTLFTEEVLEGKRIYTHIILTNFEQKKAIIPIKKLPQRLGVLHYQQIAAWQRMTPVQRLQIAFDAYQFALDAVRLTERQRHPNLSQEEFNWRVVRRMQGNQKLGREKKIG